MNALVVTAVSPPSAREHRAKWNALQIAAVGAEAVVISTLAISSYNVAFSGHEADWLAGAPLLTVVALECMRLPLAFRLPRMRPLGLSCGVLMLAGLSVITGEAASLAFSNLIDQRTRPVAEAERVLAKAEIDRSGLQAAVDRRTAEIARIQADVETARKHRADIDKPPELQAAPAGKTCVGKRGYTWNCSAGAQAAAVAANAAAMKAHATELTAASEAVRAAEGRLAAVTPAPDMRAVDTAIAEAKRTVADARAVNPMMRVAAAWQQTPVEDLTLEQFESVKHWAVIALATATALATALAAIISSLPERDSRPGKLTLVLRRLVAARRRKVRVEYRDRIRVLHIPVDRATGLILDPDGGKP